MSPFLMKNSKKLLLLSQQETKFHKQQSSSSSPKLDLKINSGENTQIKQNAKAQNLSRTKKLGQSEGEILYLDVVVKKHISKIPENRKKRIQESIHQKLSTQPKNFGEPLWSHLHPYRKLRVGTYRVIFEIMPQKQILICAIGHRSVVYDMFSKRR